MRLRNKEYKEEIKTNIIYVFIIYLNKHQTIFPESAIMGININK